jgi:hypothetical protein
LGHLLLNNILFGFSNPKDTSALLATFSALLGNLVSRLRGTPMFFFQQTTVGSPAESGRFQPPTTGFSPPKMLICLKNVQSIAVGSVGLG